MRINLSNVFVDDQAKALQFYSNVLGFVLKRDIPLGKHRWLTVVSPAEPNGTELLLEPDEHPAVKPFKAALAEDGIPYASFAVTDVGVEYERLSELGVRFIQPPTDLGAVVTAVLDDTCGNLIQIAQTKGA
jgi:catechol 2,3-dioxygenase-like lactoylglutathione lyase family enzyme